eukprot:12466590-Alexandrium_andersonii.AAC.1
MSASLVGSEMCIRDSVESSDEAGRGVRRRHFTKLLEQQTPKYRSCLNTCLLYTSDAADDM